MSASHRTESADRYRKDDPDRRFLQSRAWRERIRPAQLARQPLCEHCNVLGYIVAATQVDHKIRPKGDRQLQRSPDNFQSLCAQHHQAKSLWERRNTTRPLVLGYGTDGWPIELPRGCVEKENEPNAQPMGQSKRELVDGAGSLGTQNASTAQPVGAKNSRECKLTSRTKGQSGLGVSHGR